VYATRQVRIHIVGGMQTLLKDVKRMSRSAPRSANWLREELARPQADPFVTLGLRLPYIMNESVTVFGSADGPAISDIELAFGFFDKDNDTIVIDVRPLHQDTDFDALFHGEVDFDEVPEDAVGYLVFVVPDVNKTSNELLTLEATAVMPYGGDVRSTEGILLTEPMRGALLNASL
jgi:hypothetical protein